MAWLPPGEPDVARTLLVEAFDAFTAPGNETLARFVIPANTAVEVAVGSIMTSWLRASASAARVRGFLNDAATYSHQLNVLLPAMVSALGGPQLPGDIRAALNRLRGLRNDIAHSGTFKKPITRAEAAECLCAAFFGVEYLRMIEQLRQSA